MREKLQEYAKLLIEVGLNVQEGQLVRIQAPAQCFAFARLCVDAAYDRKCRKVIVDFSDDMITRSTYLRAEDSVFDEVPIWQADKINSLAREGVATLSLAGGDPEAMRGVDPDRIRRSTIATHTAVAEAIALQMSSEVPWCIGAVPTPAWAKKVFPGVSEEEAIASLWEAIFAAMRITGDGGAVARWETHIETISARLAKLNEYAFDSLRYQNSLGTDFTVRLHPEHIWLGGADKTGKGYPFVANMPTEEVFTTPLREGAEGTLVSSMPFSLHGNLIEPFTLTLHKGKIISVKAVNAEQLKILETAISMDEGAAYLGEVALVPIPSPIASLGLLFYNTLFDENAACHFAFGRAYASSVKGGEQIPEPELSARGINFSVAHVDFMIGTPDLSITGIMKDGTEVPVFVEGKFTF